MQYAPLYTVELLLLRLVNLNSANERDLAASWILEALAKLGQYHVWNSKNLRFKREI